MFRLVNHVNLVSIAMTLVSFSHLFNARLVSIVQMARLYRRKYVLLVITVRLVLQIRFLAILVIIRMQQCKVHAEIVQLVIIVMVEQSIRLSVLSAHFVN